MVVKLAMVAGVVFNRGSDTRLGLDRFRGKRQSINTLKKVVGEDKTIYEREKKRRASILQRATILPYKVD